MKFKKFLLEQELFYKGIAEMLSSSSIPITSKVSKLLGFEQKNIEVFHCTTNKHLSAMIKLQNSKKHISTFTKGLSNLLDKIIIKPDVMFVLKGNSVMEFEHDIFSTPDKYGRRWLSTTGTPKSQFLQDAINIKVIKQMLLLSGKDLDPYNVLADKRTYKEIFNLLNKKQKTEIVQMYFDKIHDMMTKPIYTKIVKDILSINKISSTYNEIILNNFKIIGAYALENGRYQYNHDSAKDDIESKKIKYLGFISQSEFKNY